MFSLKQASLFNQLYAFSIGLLFILQSIESGISLSFINLSQSMVACILCFLQIRYSIISNSIKDTGFTCQLLLLFIYPTILLLHSYGNLSTQLFVGQSPFPFTWQVEPFQLPSFILDLENCTMIFLNQKELNLILALLLMEKQILKRFNELSILQSFD